MASGEHDLAVAVNAPRPEGEDPRYPRIVSYRRNQTGSESQLTVYGRGRNADVSPHRQLVVRRQDTTYLRRLKPGKAYRLFGTILFVLSLGYFLRRDPSITPTDYAARTKHVMSTTPLIDGHNDLPALIRVELKNHIYDRRFTFREGLLSTTDLVKLRAGRVGGQFWSAYIPCVDDVADDFNVPTHLLRDTLEQIDVSKRLFDEYEELEFCRNASCVMPAFESGKIASMIGIEGLHQIDGSIAAIREVYELGVRYITLTHNCDNVFATSATHVTAGGTDNGLSSIGRTAVLEMNRLGLLVDLSHVSIKTMEDALQISRSPVIFSHSNSRSISDHARNAPDHVLRMLSRNGGVIMITFVPYFVNVRQPDAADISAVVDHIFHIVEVAGWDHVGIGGDFDAITVFTNGLESVATYPKLIEAVMKRGATDAQVRKLLGENVLRVWKANEEISQRLKDNGEMPWEDVWEGRKWTRSSWIYPQMFLGSEKTRIRRPNGLP
ncbi:putative dipeptidase [Xylogone sp. PMI_703]|nr:putative dipeptidase [Xylogone sp. PMI_703]